MTHELIYQIINLLFWWSGAVVWFIASCLVLWFVFEALWGACVACSFVRFCLKASDSKISLKYIYSVPLLFFKTLPDFIGFRHGSQVIYSEKGKWSGFGRWVIYSKPNITFVSPVRKNG